VIRGSATERRGLERITTDDFSFCSFLFDCFGVAEVDDERGGPAGSA
jgi:hypothetical protein